MNRFSVVLSLIIIGACLSAVPGFGATWHVEQNGTGDFLEIQDAVNASAVGDTILIGPGNYNQAREIQIPQYPAPTDAFVNLTVEGLTLIGVGPDEVIIGPSQYYTALYGTLGICAAAVSQSWRVEGVTLRNLFTGIYTYTHVEVIGCRFEENRNVGISLLNNDGALIEGSQFNNNLFNGIVNYNSNSGIRIIDCDFNYSLVYLRSAVGSFVERCAFSGGETRGGAGGLKFERASGTVSHCVFSGYVDYGLAGINVSNVDVDSCNIQVLGTGISALTFSRFSVSSSVIEGEIAGVSIGGDGSMTVNNSHILSNAGYLVKCDNRGGIDPTRMDFESNYWGTANLDDIAAGIWDKNDASYLTTIIDYFPIATGPVSVEQKSVGDVKAMFR